MEHQQMHMNYHAYSIIWHKINELSNLPKKKVKDIISNENCKISEDTLPPSRLFWQLKGIHKTIRFLLMKYGVQLKTPKTLNETAAAEVIAIENRLA